MASQLQNQPVEGSNERPVSDNRRTHEEEQCPLCVDLSSMGSRVTRMIRNFNLENRAFREISKAKPQAAPRHPASGSFPQEGAAGEIVCYVCMLEYSHITCAHKNCFRGEGPCPMSLRKYMTYNHIRDRI